MVHIRYSPAFAHASLLNRQKNRSISPEIIMGDLPITQTMEKLTKSRIYLWHMSEYLIDVRFPSVLFRYDATHDEPAKNVPRS